MIKVKNVVHILSYLIGFIGFLSVFRYVGWFYSAVFIALLLSGVYVDRKEKEVIPRIFLNLISLAVVVFLFFRVSEEDLVVPVLETLLLFLGIKFVENKNFRDFMQIYTISVFLLAGSALLTIDLSFMFFFISLFFTTVLAIILLTYYSQDKDLSFDKSMFKKVVKGSSIIPLMAIPFTALLFVILPRTEQPVFSFFNFGSQGKTGFSDIVELGDVSNIQEVETVAMRIKVNKKLDPENVYIRGIVLNFFDGKRWLRKNIDEKDYVEIKSPVKQEIILEPTGRRYILAFDVPVKINIRGVQKDGDFVYRYRKNIYSRAKYTAVSDIEAVIRSNQIDYHVYTQLPKNIHQKIKELAQRLKGEDDRKTVTNIINYLRNNYRYTLKNLPSGDDPLYRFLFVGKKGNCEYFASTAALLLRLNKIPVRLVAGYRGMRYNAIGDYFIVPYRYAHTWIEVYMNGKWIRFDPTPSYSAFMTGNEKGGLFEKIKLIIDAVEYAYINSIINYDIKNQLSILKKTESFVFSFSKDLRKIKDYLPYVLVSLVFSVFVFLIIRIKSESYEERLIKRFNKKMERLGYVRKTNEGLEEFAEKIKDKKLKENILTFVREFERVYYNDKKLNKDEYKRLISLIDNINIKG